MSDRVQIGADVGEVSEDRRETTAERASAATGRDKANESD